MRRTAETVINKAIIETMRSTPTGERGRRVIRDLDEAGYAIVSKTAAIDCPAAFDRIRLALGSAHDIGKAGAPYNFDGEARHLLGRLATDGIGVFPIECYTPPAAVGALGFEGADFLNLRSGYFAQDGKVERYPADLVQDWLATMAALPLDPATRPTGEDVAVVVMMPDGTAIPMTGAESNHRANYRDEPGRGRQFTDREISDMLVPGYHKALLLIRGGHPTASEVAKALGGDPSAGPEGDIWALFDDRLRTFLTGRTFDVAYAAPGGGTKTVRHAEAVVLHPGMLEELPYGFRAQPIAASHTDPRARAVMDIVESKRLVAKAESVLGSEAVDELLSWLPDVAEPPSRAA